MARHPACFPMRHAQRGFLLIAAVALIVIGAMLASVMAFVLVSGAQSAGDHLQSNQSLFVAESGLEYEQRRLAQNLDWYRSAADPIATSTQNFGQGSFTVYSNLPATLLRTRIPTAASTAPVRVYTTNRFPTSGIVQVEDDISGSAEFIQYAGISGDTFTGITRNVTVGGVTGASGAGAHARGSRVYPVTTLVAALASTCTAPTTFQINDHAKFLSAGTLDIEGEEISYAGSSRAGGVMTLTGVQRCRGTVGPVAHNAGRPVTPVLVGGDVADYEAEAISTSTAGAAAREMRKTIQR